MCHEYNGKNCLLDFCLDRYPKWKEDFERINGRKPNHAEIDQLEIYLNDWLQMNGYPGTDTTPKILANREKYGNCTFKKFMADKMTALS